MVDKGGLEGCVESELTIECVFFDRLRGESVGDRYYG